MGYILDLRRKVGHERLIMVGAGVLPYRDGKLLLQRRRDNGFWADHGGSLEPGEELEQTARRELKEETGLEARKLELLGVFSGPDMDYTYPNGDEVAMVSAIYLCRDFSGTLRAQAEEVAELRWFPLDQLPENIFPVTRRPLAACLEKLRQEESKKK